MKQKWKVAVTRTVWSDKLELRIGITDDHGRTAIAQPFVLKIPENEGAICEPCALLTIEAGQLLIDELWHAGMRPTEGTGSAGSLAATERHLADMRSIAFSSLNFQTP